MLSPPGLLQRHQVRDDLIQLVFRQLHVGHEYSRFDALRVAHPGLQVFLAVCDRSGAERLHGSLDGSGRDRNVPFAVVPWIA